MLEITDAGQALRAVLDWWPTAAIARQARLGSVRPHNHNSLTDAKYAMEVSLRKKVIDGLLWSAARTWGSKVLVLALFVVLSRLLDPREFGVVAAAMAVLAFLQMFVDQGLADAIVQRKEVGDGQLNAVFVLNMVVALLVVAGAWIAAPYVALRVGEPEVADVLRMASLAVPLTALSLVQVAMNRRHFHYRQLAVRTMLATLVAGIVAVGMAVLGAGSWSLVAQFIVQAGVGTLVLWWRPEWKPSRSFDVSGLRELMTYGSQRLGTSLLHYGNTKYVELYIAATLGATTLGIYMVGVRVYESLLQMLNGAVLDVAHSGFSRLAHDPERLRQAYYRAIRISAALAMPVFVLVGVLAEPIVVTVFGEKWLPSAPVMQWMGLLGAMQVLQFYNGTLNNAMGMPGIAMWINLGKLFATLAVLWVMRSEPLDQLVGAYVGVQALAVIPSFWVVRWRANIRLREVWAVVRPFVVSCGVAAVATLLLLRSTPMRALPSWEQLLLAGGAGALAYAACAALLAREFVLSLAGQIARRLSGLRRGQPPAVPK
ncbi:MAG TPA: lipopolysaccharide biosynthesis protein [Burkholderiaceae bacterium]|nr:lipopolysaccharide biosynthesis protein [Burkholderiaceae bacterium]